LVDAATTDVSATDIRRALAEGRPVTGMLPDAVATYAKRQDLYRVRAAAEKSHE
jgi:nicotinic acid mononucleotide adenylyltransferase